MSDTTPRCGVATAAAEPVPADLLEAYRAFLTGELNLLEKEKPREIRAQYEPRPEVAIDDPICLVWAEEVIAAHEERMREGNAHRLRMMAMPVFRSPASTRAALLMSTVGVDWRRA